MKPSPTTDSSRSRESTPDTSRRQFIQSSSLLLTGGAVPGDSSGVPSPSAQHAMGSDVIRVGLIGCGGRGTGAVSQALNTAGGQVRLTAMGDLFADRLQTAYRTVKSKFPDAIDVGRDTRFVGFDAFAKVMASDVDVVILATPPGFRAQHFEAAVAAGKHVFMEKPVATDAPGVRRVLLANESAKRQGLLVQVGLQRRHQRRYQECIERIHQGDLGEILYARAYWNGGGMWQRKRQQNDTTLQYQCRNWYYFNWLSGDHITEQHVHNLDVINWALQSHPISAQGQGGRQVRTGPDTGQIFDHHFVEYEYPGGIRLLSQCRHQAGCWNNVGEYLHGTLGYANVSKGEIYDRRDRLVWKSKHSNACKGWQASQDDLFAALRSGASVNQADYGAISTMTAIMGRMATYSGKQIRWEDAIANEHSLANTDALQDWNSPAPVTPNPNGNYPTPTPGQTPPV